MPLLRSLGLAGRAIDAARPLARLSSAWPSVSASASRPIPSSLAEVEDASLLHLLVAGLLSPHTLELTLGDPFRAVELRRAFTAISIASLPAASRPSSAPVEAMSRIPLAGFDAPAFYASILNTNCESVIGFIPYPLGIVGPLPIDGKEYRVPLATTEGALIASTNRGCAAIRRAGGATTALVADGMTRAPLVRFQSLKEAAAFVQWINTPRNNARVAAAFASTSRYGRVVDLTPTIAGRNVYLRFKCSTGDAMGMNMITKGVSEALTFLQSEFPTMRIIALSGNLCTDKKPSAINWVSGRGKSVTAEVVLSGHLIRSVLKTSATALAELNTGKNLVGSALAGSIGGFNAHASNIVTAFFLATGQDPAQNVESSNCITQMDVDSSVRDEADPNGSAGPGLVVSTTMPCVEVGTIGGGTSLPAQAACLELLGLRGAHETEPGENARTLARVVAATVLAGELSLMSALTSNDLVSAHIKLNRKVSAGAAPSVLPGTVTAALAAGIAEARRQRSEIRVAAGGGSGNSGAAGTAASISRGALPRVLAGGQRRTGEDLRPHPLHIQHTGDAQHQTLAHNRTYVTSHRAGRRRLSDGPAKSGAALGFGELEPEKLEGDPSLSVP